MYSISSTFPVQCLYDWFMSRLITSLEYEAAFGKEMRTDLDFRVIFAETKAVPLPPLNLLSRHSGFRAGGTKGLMAEDQNSEILHDVYELEYLSGCVS